MTAERTSIRGVVETVFYSGPAFSAGRLRTANGAIVKFAGKVFVRESDAVRLEGHWVDHPKYGRQFEAEFEPQADVFPEAAAGLLQAGNAAARIGADQPGTYIDRRDGDHRAVTAHGDF